MFEESSKANTKKETENLDAFGRN